MTCHMPLGEMWSSPFPLGAAHAWQAEVLFAVCMDDDSALMQDLVSCRLGRGNGNAEENHSSDTLQLLLSNRSGTPRTLHRGSLPSRQPAAIDFLSLLPRKAYAGLPLPVDIREHSESSVLTRTFQRGSAQQ